MSGANYGHSDVDCPIGRWSGSYVMAGTGNEALEALYGAEGEGASVVKDLLEVGIGLLTRWPGEGDLQVRYFAVSSYRICTFWSKIMNSLMMLLAKGFGMRDTP